MDMTETDETEWPPHLEALIAAPANHRLLHEDDEVRVLEVTVQPGERENLHHHRWPSIMVVLARPDYRNFDAGGNEIPPSGGTPSSPVLPRAIRLPPQPRRQKHRCHNHVYGKRSLSRKGAYVNALKLRPTEVDRSSSSKGLIIARPLARSRGFIGSNGPIGQQAPPEPRRRG